MPFDVIKGTSMKTVGLIEHVASAAGVEKDAAKKVIEVLFAGIIDAARKDDEVNLPEFGKFKVKNAARRQAATRQLAKPSRSQPRASSGPARPSRSRTRWPIEVRTKTCAASWRNSLPPSPPRGVG